MNQHHVRRRTDQGDENAPTVRAARIERCRERGVVFTRARAHVLIYESEHLVEGVPSLERFRWASRQSHDCKIAGQAEAWLRARAEPARAAPALP